MKLKTNGILSLLAALSAIVASATSVQASLDSKIESAAKKSYVFKTYLKHDSIKTVSKDGLVTLTGTVSEDSHISLAGNTVESLPGVVGVDNQLTVSGAPQDQHSDTWISMKVKSTLLYHRHVSGTGTTVYVKDGVVTLEGEATSMAEKELTTEYVRDIDNVKEVDNNMTVAQAPAAPDSTLGDRIDDASITAQAKEMLMSHRSTSAMHTKVVTADGVVTLTGIAQNEAEKALVTKLVTDINGVIRVVNNMTVAVPVAGN